MMVGALGNIPFYVTMDESALLSGLSWSSGARYSEHARHGETDMLEYTGNNPDQITFDIKLSAFLGINPSRMLESLRTLHKDHKAVKFALGTLPIPGYWVLSDMSVNLEHFHKDGTLLSADVQVTLKEYIEAMSLPVITSHISFVNRMTGSGRITPPPPPTPPATVQPSSTPSRSPSVPATTKPVSMSSNPVTKPVVTASAVAKAATYVKKLPAVVSAVGTKVVSTLTKAVNNLSIVQALKKAFTTPTVPAVKAAPAKPVVVKPAAKANVKGYTK